jgi:hypothetical protein
MRSGVLVASLIMLPQATFAHPGGLAADGCHKDNKNGGRHCHGTGSSGASKAPSRAVSMLSAVGPLFPNCAAARAAGAAPVRVGDAGYGRHLDSDGDGVGCE